MEEVGGQGIGNGGNNIFMFVKSRHEISSLRNNGREWQYKLVSAYQNVMHQKTGIQRVREKKVRNHLPRVQVPLQNKSSEFLIYFLSLSIT